jgi:N-formylglutamate deformylase
VLLRLERARTRVVPIVVEVPHAGVELPGEICASLMVEASHVRRDADSYVDEIFRRAPDVGATLLVANVSRYVVDLNRDVTDVDEWSVRGATTGDKEHPRGVIWRESGEGVPVLRAPLSQTEFKQRIERYYVPYHQTLSEEVRALRQRSGNVLVLAGHSMPSTATSTSGRIIRRADVVPGTLGSTSAHPELLDAVDGFFRSIGLSVRRDDPYRGGSTTARWGRPSEGIHAIQIEYNRALYMNERTCTPIPDRITWLSDLSARLIVKLGEIVERL